MSDRPPRNEDEQEARRELVGLARAMLLGELSFIEGADRIWRLQDRIGGILDHDPDFNAFAAIVSETDHLPLERVRPLWSDEVLKRLTPEFERSEKWASEFASEECRSLLSRFSG